MKLTWLGHAGFYIEGSKNVVIDPWLIPDQNPKAAFSWEKLGKVDFVVVTHDHFDHFNQSAIELVKRDKAKFISVFETSLKAKDMGAPENLLSGGNKGGTQVHDGVSFTLVRAEHSGNESGVIIKMDGQTIYHAGDTDVFSEMALISELYEPTIALLPIGSHFTMGPREAAKAVELLNSAGTLKHVIPMHYATFPLLVQNADDFVEEVKKRIGESVKVVTLNPGESLEV